MAIGGVQKLFGIGPLGAAISLAALAAAAWVDPLLGCAVILADPTPLQVAGAGLAVAGAGLLAGSLWTMRAWWAKDQLCTRGPFRWFRHPMYAAWITFIFPGAALFFNSWVLLAAAALLHPVWHLLVRSEEQMMLAQFQDAYRVYAARTGRFIPRFWQRHGGSAPCQP